MGLTRSVNRRAVLFLVLPVLLTAWTGWTDQAQQPSAGGRGQAPGGRGAQPVAVKNPLEGNTDAIRTGGGLYRQRCSMCHGADAKGAARGSDLTVVWTDDAYDVQVFQTARRGVPNTLLSHSFGPDEDLWSILAYLRTLSSTAPAAASGRAENGERIFSANCGGCHQVAGHGGHLGPDLSRVGISRSRPLLAHKIRHASSYFMSVYQGGVVLDGFQPVTLVTREGQEIRGVKKNEDAFSIQIMDLHERLQGYTKASLRDVVNDKTSLMPDFGPDKMSDHDLNDLLAYLTTLRNSDASQRSER
jgi:putative heme-binding domain-containing protein